jgi:hypothetical protein
MNDRILKTFITMGKQKFQCKVCGAILKGGHARREHCQTHHPAVPFGKLDMFFKIEYREINDEPIKDNTTQLANISAPVDRPILQNRQTTTKPESPINNTPKDKMDVTSLIQQSLARRENIFITGKAGTGKTTLLKQIVKDLKANKECVAVLAPTGVAAKNAGGVTIHSFLRLPISPYLPNVKMPHLYGLNSEGQEVIKHVDTIIIDEISMVRCDLLDMVDDVLRHYRHSKEIFGGVRIIVFGDLYQLMPVVTQKDWTLMKEWYRSPYFFSSKVYEGHPFKMITLQKVYRQTDSNFLDLLNEVRNGTISNQTLALLGKKYRESKDVKPKDNVIRLTTHNRLANNYNTEVFQSLKGPESEYSATITGFVHPVEYPTFGTLVLKKGARVMFVKNDTLSHSYVNGTLGTVLRCDSHSVSVKIDGDNGTIISVTPQMWSFDEYYYNRATHTLDLRHRGSFTQIPLKLAWAITIHKSQGLTFDHVIIDAGKAFTYSQVYVALSRCRKFEGITLVTPITAEIIKTDPIVKHFMNPDKDNEELPAFKIQRKSNRKPKKPNNIHGDELLKWLAEHDFTIEEMRVETGYQNNSLVYHDLCKLISRGKLGIACRLSNAKIHDMERAWKTLGLFADIRDVKPLCKTEVNFGELEMVKSHLEYMSKRRAKL